jgi:GTP cyclohydrolase-4
MVGSVRLVSSSTVYLALGSNLGDRRSNLLDAIGQLRRKVRIVRVSSLYETEPAYLSDQPAFLNLVLEAAAKPAELPPDALLAFVKGIERGMGRTAGIRYGPRPIDIDILTYGDHRVERPELTIPHPRIAERAFVLAPLAELAPGLVLPGQSEDVASLARRPEVRGQVLCVSGKLDWHLVSDVQEQMPLARLSLTRAGVSGLRRIVRLGSPPGPELFDAVIDVSAELRPDQKGVHMSRFSDTVEEIMDEASVEEAPTMEALAERIARQILRDQRTRRSDVHLRAQFPLERHAPVTGKPTQEVYTLIGVAAATRSRVARLVGVEASGMMACPCAQDMVAAQARARLLEEGFSPAQAERALELVPVATHNQRGVGTLLVGTEELVDARDLVAIVEGAMSSEVYGLLKRPDEHFVVAKAHRRPRFVEDAVREMLSGVVERYPGLPDDAFVLARQVNDETIHRHQADAERSATVGELRAELDGRAYVHPHTTLDVWLRARLGGAD